MTSQIMLAVLVAVLGQTTPAGSISGVVVNASRESTPVAGAEVVLRVMLEGEFVIAAEGIADEQGRFIFDNIPADADYIYLPGANREGIHYPGARVKLSPQTPHARVILAIHETVSDPNPLVVRRHDISIHPETDALRVTETLLIENPSSLTYVGRPAKEGGRASTIRLSIPSNFRRTTFQKEFYGRQFTLFEGRLVTDIPWTPGQREIAFTYVLSNEARNRIWQRPLDLPCDYLRIELHTDSPDGIACNLSRVKSQTKGTVIFESTGQTLQAGFLVSLQIGQLPISISTYGRWVALIMLGGLIAATCLIGAIYRRRKQSRFGNRQRSAALKKAA